MRTEERIELRNGSEAARFENILEQEGIPCRLVSHHSTPYDGIFQLQNGWGFAEVPGEYHRKALELLETYRRTFDQETE